MGEGTADQERKEPSMGLSHTFLQDTQPATTTTMQMKCSYFSLL